VIHIFNICIALNYQGEDAVSQATTAASSAYQRDTHSPSSISDQAPTIDTDRKGDGELKYYFWSFLFLLLFLPKKKEAAFGKSFLSFLPGVEVPLRRSLT
jgi:hypothetical protein